MIYCVYAHERARPEREDFYFDGMQRIRVKCVTTLCIRDFQFRFSYYLSPAGMSGGISWQIAAGWSSLCSFECLSCVHPERKPHTHTHIQVDADTSKDIKNCSAPVLMLTSYMQTKNTE